MLFSWTVTGPAEPLKWWLWQESSRAQDANIFIRVLCRELNVSLTDNDGYFLDGQIRWKLPLTPQIDQWGLLYFVKKQRKYITEIDCKQSNCYNASVIKRSAVSRVIETKYFSTGVVHSV